MKKVILLLLALTACSTPPSAPAPDYTRELPPGQLALRKITDPARIPDFSRGISDRESTIQAIDQSLAYMSKPSSKAYFPYLDITHERAVTSLKRLKEILSQARSGAELHSKIVAAFDVYESIGWDGSGEVLFTAYCEPIYQGSLTASAEFRYPLYRLPPDLVKAPDGTPQGRRTSSGEITHYFTRREIEEGYMLRGHELVYLKDPLEAYIVHVQGSARIQLPDKREMRIGYAGKTDRGYRSVGLELVKDGRFPKTDLSLQRIKTFFREHPELVHEYLYRNESYVFFTERQGGPYGSLNVPLTAERSIATDKAVFPRAAAAFVVMTGTAGRFALDQDTGGAIRSAGRCDLFLGSGPAAESRAGKVNDVGRLYYLFVR